MLIKSLITLKNNPMVIALFVLVMIISAVSVMLLMPDINSMMEISREMSQNPTNPPDIDPQEILEMLSSTVKLLLYSLVACGFAVVFVAGVGNMLAAAVNNGKASLKIFFFGIKKFFGKTLLSFLLLAAFIFGFSIIISIVSIPFTITGVINGNFNPDSVLSGQKIITVFSNIVMILLYPFVLLWLPAIYLDRNEGVLACFRNGFKAGVKKYIILVAVTTVMLLPTLFIYVFSKDIFTILDSPYYYLMYIYQIIITPVLLTFLFILYNEMRKKRLGIDDK